MRMMLLLVALVAAVSYTYRSISHGNLPPEAPVDVLLVLGSPAGPDGLPGEQQRWRVEEAVREYRAGRAAHVLMSGGPVLNRFAEAQTMTRYAQRLGVPATAIEQESTSWNTLENIEHSRKLIDLHGWKRVEVISSAEHLPRAALFLEHTPLQWRTHAAPTPGRTRLDRGVAVAEEALGTALIRWFGVSFVPVLHSVAVLQHRVAWAIRTLFYRISAHLAGHPRRSIAVLFSSR